MILWMFCSSDTMNNLFPKTAKWTQIVNNMSKCKMESYDEFLHIHTQTQSFLLACCARESSWQREGIYDGEGCPSAWLAWEPLRGLVEHTPGYVWVHHGDTVALLCSPAAMNWAALLHQALLPLSCFLGTIQPLTESPGTTSYSKYLLL